MLTGGCQTYGRVSGILGYIRFTPFYHCWGGISNIWRIYD